MHSVTAITRARPPEENLENVDAYSVLGRGKRPILNLSTSSVDSKGPKKTPPCKFRIMYKWLRRLEVRISSRRSLRYETSVVGRTMSRFETDEGPCLSDATLAVRKSWWCTSTVKTVVTQVKVERVESENRTLHVKYRTKPHTPFSGSKPHKKKIHNYVGRILALSIRVQ